MSTRSKSSQTTSTFSSSSSSGTSGLGGSERTVGIPLNFSDLGLVGRTKQIQVLTNAYERVLAGGAAEMVWVHGASGTGKSTLVVGALEDTVVARGGFFAMGKFEQPTLMSNSEEAAVRPCSAIGNAMTELCYLIQDSPHKEEISNKLKEVLPEKQEWEMLATLIPGIRILTRNDTSEPHEKSGDAVSMDTERMRWALLRFLGVLKSFLRAICAASPFGVVLFLDDLQWADEFALLVMEALAQENDGSPCLNNLLLIGAFRDDAENGGSLELMDMVTDTMLPVSDVPLGPLSEESVNEIVARATEMRTEQTKPLGKIVFLKTQGNAFFVIQYVEMLHQHGLLGFSFRTNRWEWDEASIQENTNVCDNVAALLIAKVSALSHNAQLMLEICACLGFTFDKHVLEEIVTSHDLSDLIKEKPESLPTLQDEKKSNEISNTAFSAALQEAIQAGLIETSSSSKQCKFSHDRVQQAAVEMMPSGQQGQAFRYRLGQVILAMSRKDSAEDWMLFTSVDLLTRNQSDQNQDPSLALELAHLSLVASRKAAEKSAFVSAAKYTDRGLSLLQNTGPAWEDQYELCLELVTLSAEMHYSYGNFESSIESISVILERARCLQDKLRAYRLSVAIHGAGTDLLGAIREGVGVLKQLGVSVPRNPTGLHVVRAVSKTKRLLRNGGLMDLQELPPMTDLAMSEAMRVLGRLIVFDWRSDQKKNLAIHAATMMQLTLKYGFCSYSPYAVAVWGATLSHFGELEEAYKFGLLAEEMLQRDDMRESYGYAETIKAIHLLFAHLKRPLHESIAPLLHGYQVARRIGDPQMASCCIKGHALFSFFVGMTLDNMEKQLQSYCDFCREFKQEPSLLELLPFLQLVINLRGKSDNPLVLSGRGMVEKDFIEKLCESSDRFLGTVMLGSARLILFYVFDELNEAETERKKYNPVNDFVGSYFTKYINFFFCGLVCLGLARKTKKRHYLRLCRFYTKEVERYAKCGSVNSVPMLKLLCAEGHSVRDPKADVSNEYNEAIAMAGRCGFRLIKAIACERAGGSMLAQGNTARACDYLKQAWQEYAAYGANAKVLQLEKKYASVVRFEDMSSVYSKPSRLLQPHLVQDKVWKQEV